MNEFTLSDAHIIAVVSASHNFALGANAGSPEAHPLEKFDAGADQTPLLQREIDASHGQATLAQMGTSIELEQAFQDQRANATNASGVEAALADGASAWRETTGEAGSTSVAPLSLTPHREVDEGPSKSEHSWESQHSQNSAFAAAEGGQVEVHSIAENDVLPIGLLHSPGKPDRSEENAATSGVDQRDEHQSTRRKPFSGGAGFASGAGGDANLDADRSTDLDVEADVDFAVAGEDNGDDGLSNKVPTGTRVGVELGMGAELHQRIEEDEDDEEHRRKQSEALEEESENLPPPAQPFTESLSNQPHGPGTIISSELSHRELLSLLLIGGQHDALREIRLRRRVLLVVPSAVEKSTAGTVVEAYLIGQDAQARGWVCHFGSCHWCDTNSASLPQVWQGWRVHRDTDATGTTWLRSARSAHRGDSGHTFAVRLGQQGGAVSNPLGAALEIRDAHRFLQVLGLQWSLMVAISPTAPRARSGQP